MFCSRCGTWAPEPSTVCGSCGAPLLVGEQTAKSAPAQVGSPRVAQWPRQAFGGFWRRFGASVVDSVILYFPQAIAKVMLGIPLWSAGDETSFGAELLVNLGGLVLYWLYSGLLESSSRQATLGQQVLGLRIMDLEGRRITFARASGRYFAQIFSVLLCGVGYLFNLWTSRRQTLHDLIAGCVAVIPERVPQTAPAQAGELV